jgi:hypothetical protein
MALDPSIRFSSDITVYHGLLPDLLGHGQVSMRQYAVVMTGCPLSAHNEF